MVLHLDPSLASHNFGRGMTETARAPMLTPNVYANVMRLPQLAVRSLGLAARFVSGYLHVPSCDGPEYVGGGSTHAWCQVYLPGAGWVEFDPTNGIIGNRDLIRVAVARDPAQAVPLSGTYVGDSEDELGMKVEVSVKCESDPRNRQ
jgi:transglutaminase-like putative cysteine protease